MKLSNGWFLIALLPALAYGQDQANPPSRVARLNYIYGTVSYRPALVNDWAPAAANFPLTTGDHLWTDAGGNAEMHVGSSAIRLSSQAAFAILNLDDRSAEVSLSQGSMNLRIPQTASGESFEVDTPNGAVTLTAPGDYRIDVNSDKNFTDVTVRAGKADVAGDGQAFGVETGQQSRFMGTEDLVTETVGAPTPDGWDNWCESRDQHFDQAVQLASNFVPPDMTGVEDLAASGTWRDDPTYGAVWTPAEAADPSWQPYKDGHWSYVEPWGWTWVDDAPWGFAPFHYGRWAMAGGTWGWAPGVYIGARPMYSPAMVAFVGGDGFGLDVSAWVPLGPGEPFLPWYAFGGPYFGRINVGLGVVGPNVGIVAYMNAPHVVAAPRAVFAGGGSIAAGAVRVSPSAAAHLHSAVISARPTTESRMGGAVRPGVVAARPPANVANRTVLARNASTVRSGDRVRAANPSAPRPVAATPHATPAMAARPAGSPTSAPNRAPAPNHASASSNASAAPRTAAVNPSARVNRTSTSGANPGATHSAAVNASKSPSASRPASSAASNNRTAASNNSRAAAPTRSGSASTPARTNTASVPARTNTASTPTRTNTASTPTRTNTASTPTRTNTASTPTRTNTASTPTRTNTSSSSGSSATHIPIPHH